MVQQREHEIESINKANREMDKIQIEIERLTLKCSHSGGRFDHSMGAHIDSLREKIHQMTSERNQTIRKVYKSTAEQKSH